MLAWWREASPALAHEHKRELRMRTETAARGGDVHRPGAREHHRAKQGRRHYLPWKHGRKVPLELKQRLAARKPLYACPRQRSAIRARLEDEGEQHQRPTRCTTLQSQLAPRLPSQSQVTWVMLVCPNRTRK